MLDIVKLTLYGGDGGNGKVSFRREKFIPKGGPDGGDAGDGGSIYVVGDKHLNTLQHFSGVKEFRAPRGEDGGRQKMIGHNGEDIILHVPIGTIIWLLAENTVSKNRRLHVAREGSGKPEVYFDKYYLQKPQGKPPEREEDDIMPVGEMSQQDEEGDEVVLRSASLKNLNLKSVPKEKLIEIIYDGQEVLLCEGGHGGRGNIAFKGSTNTTPFEAEYGTYGEKRVVLFELRLLADVGLVGYPNAGKSTFLSIVTKANPKIANYPFTTLEPNLGVMSGMQRDLVLADIPGLIEGASEGKGLGYSFLRHVQACKVLLFILSVEESILFDESLSIEAKAVLFIDQFTILRKELATYDEELLAKPVLVAISKADLYSPELMQAINNAFLAQKYPVHFFSSITKQGISDLKLALSNYFPNN